MDTTSCARAARAIAVVEVPSAQERHAHRLEPTRCRCVAPYPLVTPVFYEHGTIGDGDAVGAPPAAGEEWYSGDRSRSHALYRGSGVAQALDAPTPLFDRHATRLRGSTGANELPLRKPRTSIRLFFLRLAGLSAICTNFGQTVIGVLRELGIPDAETRDPIEWERMVAARG